MGNGQHRYISNNDAVEIIGGETWLKLKQKFEKYGNKAVDYQLFVNILKSRYERMPNILCESIFRAFSPDASHKVEVDNFISTLAVLGCEDRSLISKFLYRIYENDSGMFERRRVEDLLQYAWGDKIRLKAEAVSRLLDTIFEKRKREVNLKEFEQYQGSYDILAQWIVKVLNVFIEPLPPKLYSLERKYSALLESEEMMSRYNISKVTCEQLRRGFYNKCSGGMKAELTLPVWKAWVSEYVNGQLAEIVFLAKVESFRTIWRFMDFAEFCMIYGAATADLKASTLCSAFIQYELKHHSLELAVPTTASGNGGGNNGVTMPTQRKSVNFQFTANDLDGSNSPAGSVDSGGSSHNNHSSNGHQPSDAVVYRALLRMVYMLLLPIQKEGSGKDSAPAATAATGTSVKESSSLSEGSAIKASARNTPRTGAKKRLSLNRHYAAEQPPQTLKADGENAGAGADTKTVDTAACNAAKTTTITYTINSVAELKARIHVPEKLSRDLDAIQEIYNKHLHIAAEITSGAHSPGSIHLGSSSTLSIAPAFTNFLLHHAAHLPGLRDLSIAACCLFGIEPEPLLQKEYVTELMLRYLKVHTLTSLHPYGPVGTEWCILSKQWYDNWQLYVGHHSSLRRGLAANRVIKNDSRSSLSGMADVSANNSPMEGFRTRPPPPKPDHIDNWPILKKHTTGVRQLLQGVMLSQDIEVVCPSVYTALHLWYGGGPKVLRNVVSSRELHGGTSMYAKHSKRSSRSQQTQQTQHRDSVVDASVLSSDSAEDVSSGATELELFPLCLKIAHCDQHGKITTMGEHHMLFSKTATVGDVTDEICQAHDGLDPARIRLWNYARDSWKEQYILSPELSLRQANIQDGQTILLEVSQQDGSWPRSQLHANLDLAERRMQEGGDSSADADGSNEGASESGSKHKYILSRDLRLPGMKKGQQNVKYNDGLVGLDNLGNTCYMNASLQALLHTEQLMQYFLSQAYTKDINVHNIHGHKGRLAKVFGALSYDVWTTKYSCISPRYFYRELATLHEQFAGNEQHDAHELLAFLLDGLSEDLNLVHEKPYTIQPDSDGRPDVELADIWWENHLRRDLSVIQALFSGQFQSIMTCRCGYSSSRYEPFNSLTVPIPEESFRVLLIIVVPMQLEHITQVAVRVGKRSTVEDIVNRVKEFNLAGLLPMNLDPDAAETNSHSEPETLFLAAELLNSRIVTFNSMDRSIDTIRDSENLVLYQVRRLPTLRSYYSQPRGLEPSSPSSGASQLIHTPHAQYQQSSSARQRGAQNAAETKVAERQQEGESSDALAAGEEAEASESETSPAGRQQLPHLQDPVALEYNINGLYNSVVDYVTFVRIAFCQRRAKLVEGYHFGSAGFEMFKLEPFGLSILEVLPSKIKCCDLYALVTHRFQSFIKKSNGRSPFRNKSNLSGGGGGGGGSKTNSRASTPVNAGTGEEAGKDTADMQEKEDYSSSPLAIPLADVRYVDTDEVLGGAIPRDGFTLRMISGGSGGAGSTCSRCHWLQRCQGCVIPYHNTTDYVELRDGETVAVDWHYVVFEDMLDTDRLSTISRHESVNKEYTYYTESKTPLYRCLDKFTEQEQLDSVVCPKCKESEFMKRSFTIWRQPPILVVQLKRFQYDRTSRRKLNNRIDFPFDNLDLQKYMAESRKVLLQQQQQQQQQGSSGGIACGREANGSSAVNEATESSRIGDDKNFSTEEPTEAFASTTPAAASAVVAPSVAPAVADLPPPVHTSLPLMNTSKCTEYDLYSVIHHVGAMGGGHYVTTVRNDHQFNRYAPRNNNNKLPVETATGANSNGSSGSGSWYSYNDNLVNEVKEVQDISSSSAYVLFYVRKDFQNPELKELFMKQFMSLRKHHAGAAGAGALRGGGGAGALQEEEEDAGYEDPDGAAAVSSGANHSRNEDSQHGSGHGDGAAASRTPERPARKVAKIATDSPNRKLIPGALSHHVMRPAADGGIAAQNNHTNGNFEVDQHNNKDNGCRVS